MPSDLLEQHQKTTWELPFNIVNESTAIVPVEIVLVMHSDKYFRESNDNDLRCLNLNLADERRWTLEKTQGKMCSLHFDVTTVKS